MAKHSPFGGILNRSVKCNRALYVSFEFHCPRAIAKHRKEIATLALGELHEIEQVRKKCAANNLLREPEPKAQIHLPILLHSNSFHVGFGARLIALRDW